MRVWSLHRTALATGIAFAGLATAALPASAQTATAEDNAAGLGEIVVTAAVGARAQIDSAVSITAINADLIRTFQPASEAELFRMLPGIQVPGTAGPGGNANIAVRGLPVSTGGAPFVQLQEDGLPTVLFGDILFGNNDYWTRFDASTAKVEALRGGTATTLASQAPGAVINYISHTGAVPGGFVQLDQGLGFNETRLNFRYGGAISDNTNYHIGGYYKAGRGPLHADYRLSDSVQIKANLTRTFADGTSYLRLLVKFADTQEPHYNGAPALGTLSGRKITAIGPFPGFDGRRGTNYSTLNRDVLILDRKGNLESVAMRGITTRAAAVQSQLHYALGERITLDNNVRWTSMSGTFTVPFFTATKVAGLIGTQVNGGQVASLRYANGPKAGQTYAGAFYNSNTNVHTNMRDVGSLANDLTVTGTVPTAAGLVRARVGWFYMKQKMAMDWHPNRTFSEVSGNNPAMLDLYNASGNRLTAGGTGGFNSNWGLCCARDYALSYTDSAPYLALDLDTSRFVLDGSVRFENLSASGWAIGGSAAPPVPVTYNGSTTLIPAMTPTGPREVLDYQRHYLSWTAGALYKANADTSVFLRTSRGGRFNADRQTLSGKFNADGSLNQSGKVPSVDFVRQYEIGVKNRGDLLGGRYTLELTLLKGAFSRSDYEPTSTAQCPAGGCIIDTRYKSTGAELFATYRRGGLNLVGTATYTRARRASAGSMQFKRADGIPDLSYTLSANYDFAEIATIGLSTTGQTGVTDAAGFEYPGKAIFNGVIRVRPLANVELGLQAYNLFNTFDFRGTGAIVDPSEGPVLLTGNPALGRTFTGTLRYSF